MLCSNITLCLRDLAVRTLDSIRTCTLLARPLHFYFIEMQWTDILIIYLSCGAPFGVYFFLHEHRKTGVSSRLLLRSAAVWLFWIAYAYLLWRKNSAKRFTPSRHSSKKSSKNSEIALLEQQTAVMQEQILQAFIEASSRTRLKVQFFAFRDVLERFVGLTLAVKADEVSKDDNDHELFHIAGRKGRDAERAQKCLSRRNRTRLYEHQKNAREDFLKQVANLAGNNVPLNSGEFQKISALRDLILELLELLDVKLMERAENIFNKTETAPVLETNKSSNRLIEAAARN